MCGTLPTYLIGAAKRCSGLVGHNSCISLKAFSPSGETAGEFSSEPHLTFDDIF